MASIDQDIIGLYNLAKSRGQTPTILLIPYGRAKEFVEFARTQRSHGKLIIPGGALVNHKEDVGIQHLLGMQVMLSLGNIIAVQWQRGEGVTQN